MLKQYKLRDYKFRLILWVLALSILGLMVIGSAKQDVQLKQLLGIIGGVGVMVVVSLIDYTWLLNFYWIWYVICLAMLGVVLIPGIGSNVNGATRWIDLGFTSFQPSDLAKIIIIVFFAKFFSKHEEDLNTLKVILGSLMLLGIPLGLIVSEPDLSTTIAVMLVFCCMIFIAGLSYKIIGGILVVAIPAAVIFLSIITQPGQTLLKDYQLNRILAWINPSQYADTAYQQTNSVIAIGSGQLYGKGLNNNVISSVKNGNFISEPQTDFIFAVAGEELGFLGCCIIVVLELLIAYECIRIGKKARDMSGTIICCGVAALISVQSFMNICVATNLMPNTGITLPFVSYGLTSLISLYIGIGLVFNVGLQVRKY